MPTPASISTSSTTISTVHERGETPADDLPRLPWEAEDGPVFKEPWEATAFAMAVRLSEAGKFTWSEWVDYLSAEIAAAKQRGDPDLGDRYYEHWLNVRWRSS